MDDKDKIYEFDGFYIDENERRLYRSSSSVGGSGEHVHLQGKAFEILFLLVGHAGRFVTRDEILNALWSEQYVNENVITPQIAAIRNALGENRKGEFIETGHKSYKFAKEVRVRGVNKSTVTQAEPVLEQQQDWQKEGPPPDGRYDRSPSPPPPVRHEIERLEFSNRQIFLAVAGMVYAFLIILWGINANHCVGDCFEQNLFINIAGIAAGLATSTCLLLECAYQFEKFGWKVLLFIPVVFLINFGSLSTGLSLANNPPGSLLSSFAVSLFCFVAGLLFSTLVARFLLPGTAVTVARFETHPAFVAFYKNVFMYVLPLYVLFCILVYCFLFSGSRFLLHPGFPIGLFVLWLIFVFVSYFATSYLLNNLLREKDGVKYPYHGFFVSLIFVRFILFFGPTFVFILWYFIRAIEIANRSNS